MVQFPNPADLYPENEAKVAVKIENEDGDLSSPTRKRARPSSDSDPFHQDRYLVRTLRTGDVAAAAAGVEPSPLGLHLRKSPSLLDLIQMRLSQSASAVSRASGDHGDDRRGVRRKDGKAVLAGDRLKASNFPALLLRIGSWQWISRNEGDLVAKCYFAKRKLVWEILDGSLKNKIEIQWSDISALKATCPEDASGTLDLVLAREPLFFKEITPQPKKHTLWQATSDFTSGQASIHRRHHLRCAPGVLTKHIEKLILYDPHMKALTQQPEAVFDSPYFEARSPISENIEQESAESCGFDLIDCGGDPNTSGFCDASSACSAPSSSSVNHVRDPVGRKGMASPISGTNAPSVALSHQIEKLRETRGWENIKFVGLDPSMPTTDLMNHLGNCFSGKYAAAGDQLHPGSSSVNKNMPEEMAHHLLGDSQISLASDGKSLKSRLDSHFLLHNPMPIQSFQVDNSKHNKCCNRDEDGVGKPQEPSTTETKPIFELAVVEEEEVDQKPVPAISRKESVGELLFHLPHVESLPFILIDKADNC